MSFGVIKTPRSLHQDLRSVGPRFNKQSTCITVESFHHTCARFLSSTEIFEMSSVR